MYIRKFSTPIETFSDNAFDFGREHYSKKIIHWCVICLWAYILTLWLYAVTLLISFNVQNGEVSVKYRDLFEKFKIVLEAEMHKEQTDAPLVMAHNAFRGFLDEFMNKHAGRRREQRKTDKPMKPYKQKKDMVVRFCPSINSTHSYSVVLC